MYWTSHGDVVSINRAGMDGSSRERIISDGLVNPTDLTLDKAKQTLYWVDGGDVVQYISLQSRKQNVSGEYFFKTVLFQNFEMDIYICL